MLFPNRSRSPLVRIPMRHLLLTFLFQARWLLGKTEIRRGRADTLRQGVAALTRQDYVKAVAILSPLAQNGDPAAQAYLGYLYAIGRGVPQDYTQAAIWYGRTTERGRFRGRRANWPCCTTRGRGCL